MTEEELLDVAGFVLVVSVDRTLEEDARLLVECETADVELDEVVVGLLLVTSVVVGVLEVTLEDATVLAAALPKTSVVGLTVSPRYS